MTTPSNLAQGHDLAELEEMLADLFQLGRRRKNGWHKSEKAASCELEFLHETAAPAMPMSMNLLRK